MPSASQNPVGHLSAEEHLRFSPAGVVERVRNHAGDGFERPCCARASRGSLPARHVFAHLVARRMPLPDRDHPIGVRVRQRPEDQRIEQARDGNRAADAEREYEHGGGGKCRGLPQHPHAVPHVVNDLGVGGELASKPRGIGQARQGTRRNEIHLRPPVQTLAALQHVPAVTDFGFPLARASFPSTPTGPATRTSERSAGTARAQPGFAASCQAREGFSRRGALRTAWSSARYRERRPPAAPRRRP